MTDFLHSEPTIAAACAKYEDARRTEVLRLQSAARNSLEWFENVERYLHLDPVQFNYSLLTRSQRISHENLRLRDKSWLEGAEAWFQRRAGSNSPNIRRPMFAPFKLRDMALKNRVVVSPMAQYKAVDGCPTDWHLVHYGERAKGGAGLLFIEMTCVSPEGRITPGCPGMYAPQHEAAWKRIVDFVHAETDAKICCQLGHSGAKGSTQLGWEEMDAPLKTGNWPLLAASDAPWSPQNQHPRAMDRADMNRVRDQFVAAAEMADRAGFDMLELHFAHGYLLSSFITPAHQQAHRSIRRLARKPDALSAGDFSTRCAPCGPPASRFRCAFPRTTGSARRASSPRMQSRSPACCRRPASISAMCPRGKLRSARIRSTAACSRRRSRIASATRPAWRPWRSATSTRLTTSIRS